MTVTGQVPHHSYPSFSSEEMTRRHTAMRGRMDEAGVDALVVYGNGGAIGPVQYLTNWPTTVEAYLVFTRAGESSLFVHFVNHVPLAQRVAVADHVDWMTWDPASAVAADLTRRGVSRGKVGFAGPIPGMVLDGLRGQLDAVQFVPFGRTFLDLFLVKSHEELDWLRRSAALTDLSMEALERELRPGLTEWEVAQIVESAYVPHGGRTLIHFITATPMSAPDIVAPAQYESDRRTEAGDILLTEISATYWGYGAQTLRPFTIAAEPTPQYQELYDVAQAAFDAIAAVMRTGASAEEVVAASDLIGEAGYTICDDLVHGMGGGYLAPVLRTRDSLHSPVPADFRYPADSTWVIQPNVITPDWSAGIQVGELVRVTDSGAERMHGYPMKLTVCDRV
jgi:Xaa-Pro aminopeptidase